MGSSQSTSSPSASEAAIATVLASQLQTLRLSEKVRQNAIEGDSYINISTSEKPHPSPPSSSPTISITQAREWEKSLLSSPKNRLALSALLSNDPRSIITQKTLVLPDTQTFNIAIPFEGSPVTNQRSSGRCWLFATTNVLRVPLMKHYKLKEFQLSQSYLFFWDKLEKANWFLEQILSTHEEDLDSRLVQELLKAPVNDGGQWDMAANLIAKYGLVPQTLYPDSWSAMNSGAMGSILTSKLREDGLALRHMLAQDHPEGAFKAAKEKMLREVHCVLTLMLGPPPKPDEKFSWEFYDEEGKFKSVSKTPLEFARDASERSVVRALGGADVKELFSLVNDPRNEYNTLLTVDRLGNVVGGRPITYVNVSMQVMKKAAISMLKAGLPVFFGSDVGKFSNSQSGIMDPALYDYNLAFNITLSLSKAQRLKARESAMTHAMVLTAVQVDEKTGESARWRVMNSWGETAGEKGYFVMSDKWMDEFVYQVVVDPGFVRRDVRDVLKKEAVVLPLWDPMGALA